MRTWTSEDDVDPFDAFDTTNYDVEAMRIDAANGNFNVESNDPEAYRVENIVITSMQNGQWSQARRQCVDYGLDFDTIKLEAGL